MGRIRRKMHESRLFKWAKLPRYEHDIYPVNSFDRIELYWTPNDLTRKKLDQVELHSVDKGVIFA